MFLVIIFIILFSSMNDLRRISSMIQNYSVSCPDKPEKRYLFQIKVYWMSIITLLSVLVTFVFCVLWTIFFKLEDATSTHCGYRVCFLRFISTIFFLVIMLILKCRLKITCQQYQLP